MPQSRTTRASAAASRKHEADAAELGRSAAAISLSLLPDQFALPSVYAGLLGTFYRTDEALVNGQVVHKYVEEGYFGEIALLYTIPRQATVQVCAQRGVQC